MNETHTFDDFELFTHVSDSFLSIAIDTTGIEIKQDFPAIVVEGSRDKLLEFFTEVLEWDYNVDYMTHSIDLFEIAMDLEQGYISFFMKPNNQA